MAVIGTDRRKLRRQAAKIVRTMLFVKQQPVETGRCTQFSTKCIAQRKPDTDLSLALLDGALEEIRWHVHLSISYKLARDRTKWTVVDMDGVPSSHMHGPSKRTGPHNLPPFQSMATM